MTDNLHQRARAVFLELSTLDGSAASSELDRLGGDDAALRAAVVSLLDARKDANDAGLMTEETRSQLSAPLTESAGTIIGPYKILQLIGEGGFGSVFLAEQAEPVRRRVALKIIKLGMDTKQVIARFEAERQALALMDHPHIARVFDAGSTNSGRPYFAMEYVVGDAITKFADDYRLDIEARLKLLAQVCSAVQHAHTKGVIHRDLKPANVLVSMVDGKPFAKVIDFGIAKATASPLTHKTLFTEHRQLIGTPEYMSPEQAEGSPDIDTRTDVYALGVLLYELLTGATPFDATRLRSAAWAEMQRIIREEEPPIPSMRLSRDAALSQRTAATRQTEPPRLASSIRGELDWIVMKALDKDRGRRYSTPLELAEDIGKHLSGDAVEAAPPSAAYRLRKFARRNKGSVIAGAVVSAVLILGIAGTTTGLLIAQYNAKAALHNADLAMESSSEAEWSAYTANLALAQNAMDAGDWPKAREYLAACPESKRGWEWEFLGQYAHSVTIEVPGFWSAASFDSDGTLHLLGNRETSYQTEDERTYTFAVDAESIVPNGAGRQTLVALSPEDDIESSSTAWTTTFENYVGFVHDWKEQFATFHPRGWGYTIRALRHAADGRVVLSTQSFEYPHLQVFDTRSETLVGSYHYGEGEAPQIINMSGDLRWLLAIVRPDGDGWRDKYCRAVLIDTRNAGSPVRILGSGDRTRLAIADMLGSAPTEPVKSIDLPDRSRRIAIGPDRDIQFFDTSGGSDPLKQRQIASFRVPLAALSLHLSDDEQRIVVTLADGSAQVWDIRDPAERRIDIEREWNEREPATKYVASLLSSDATSDADELKESILRDDSLTPLRRYVSIDILYERLNEIALDASWEFDRITANQTDKDVVLAAARESDLVPQAKELLLAKAEAWEYRPPRASREEIEKASEWWEYTSNIMAAANNPQHAQSILDQCPEHLRGWEWHYLSASSRSGMLLLGSGNSEAYDLAMSPDGSLTANAYRGGQKEVQVRRITTGEVVATLPAPGGSNSVAFSPDSTKLLILGRGSAVSWNIATGNEAARLPVAETTSASGTFSPDGTRILTYAWARRPEIWNATTGELLARIPLEMEGEKAKDGLGDAAFSADGSQVITAHFDHAKLWDSVTGKLQQTLQCEDEQARDIRVASDGKSILGYGFANEVVVWDTDSGEVRTKLALKGTRGAAEAQFSPAGDRIVTYGYGRGVRVWDSATGSLLRDVPVEHPDGQHSAAFSPDGSKIVVWGVSSPALIDIESGEQLHELAGQHAVANNAAFSPDGEAVLTSSVDGTTRLWTPKSQNPITWRVFDGEEYDNFVTHLQFSHDGKHILSAAGRQWREWHLASRSIVREHSDQPSGYFAGYDQHAAYISDGNVLSWFDAAEVTESPDSEEVKTLVPASPRSEKEGWEQYPSQPIRATSTSGDAVLTATRDGYKIVVANTGEFLLEAEVPGSTYSEIAHQGDRILSVVFEEAVVRVFDAANGEMLYELPGQMARFDPSGSRILTLSRTNDGARIWDARSGKLICSLHLPLDQWENQHTTKWHYWQLAHRFLDACAFSPDGMRIVFPREQREVGWTESESAFIYDTSTGKQLAELRARFSVLSRIAFSPDGTRIATSQFVDPDAGDQLRDSGIRLWNAESGLQILHLQVPTLDGYGICSIAWSPDGSKLAAGGHDGQVTIFDATQSLPIDDQ